MYLRRPAGVTGGQQKEHVEKPKCAKPENNEGMRLAGNDASTSTTQYPRIARDFFTYKVLARSHFTKKFPTRTPHRIS